MKKRVAFLFDQNNSWIYNFFKDKNFEIEGFEFYNIFDSEKVFDFDIVFLIAYTRILSKEFLKKNKLTLVIHESKLPQGKGFAPLQWQLLEGKSEIIMSLFEANEKVDTGDIFIQNKIDFDGTELYEEIREKQAIHTIRIIIDFLTIYPNYKAIKQNGAESFYPRRYKEDSELDVDKTIRENFNLLRIGNNEEWPSFFFINGVKYILKIYKEK